MHTYTHIFIFSDNETAFYDKSREKRWWMSGGVNLHVHGILVFIFKYKNLSVIIPESREDQLILLFYLFL